MGDELKAIKQSQQAFDLCYRACGGTSDVAGRADRYHLNCPLCGKDSLSQFAGEHGEIAWKCHHCGEGGSLIDLLAQVRHLSDGDASREVLKEFGHLVGYSPHTPRAPASKPSGRAVTTAPAVEPDTAVTAPQGSPALTGAASGASADAPPDDGPYVYATLLDAVHASLRAMRRQYDGKRREIRLWKQAPLPSPAGEPALYGMPTDEELAKSSWDYRDATHRKVVTVVRFAYVNVESGKADKDIRPYGYVASGVLRGLSAALPKGSKTPPYRLPELLAADVAADVHITEGEKCAEALRALGFVASACRNGALSPGKTDWTPFARFTGRIYLWEDVDAPNPKGERPGERFTAHVSELLRSGGCAAELRIVRLRPWGLTDGQDVFDAIEKLNPECDTEEQLRARVLDLAQRYSAPEVAPLEPCYPGQPPPFDPDAVPIDKNGQRPRIENHVRKKFKEATEEAAAEWKCFALPIRVIHKKVIEIGKGWPARVRSAGSRNPLLFVEQAVAAAEQEGQIRWCEKQEDFSAFLQNLGTPCFRDRRDDKGANYVTRSELFCEFGRGSGVREYCAVEVRPHEPLIPEHYYSWRPPEGYHPQGKHLLEFLALFSENLPSPLSRLLAAAALVTPAWGGPYGKRPLFLCKADKTGSGKTTLVEQIGTIWGGCFRVEPTEKQLDQLLTRLLSTDGLRMRVANIDNARGFLDATLIEGLLTTAYFNGRALYRGDASRPNTMTWFLTTNEIRMPTDLAHRIIVIQMTRPTYRPRWDGQLAELVRAHGREIVADAVALLRAPLSEAMRAELGAASGSDWDRWGPWCEGVLARIVDSPLLRPWIASAEALTLAGTIAQIAELRTGFDEGKAEGADFGDGLVDWLCWRQGWLGKGTGPAPLVVMPDPSIMQPPGLWVTLAQLYEAWNEIFKAKSGASVKQVRAWVDGHIAAGRCNVFVPSLHGNAGIYRSSQNERGAWVGWDAILGHLRGYERPVQTPLTYATHATHGVSE